MPGYSLEKFVRVYDDKCGDYIQVGPDSNGLDLIEIRQHTSDGTEISVLTLTKECAELLFSAIRSVLAG